MGSESPFAASSLYQPAETMRFRDVSMAGRFADARHEYEFVRRAAGLFDRSHRGLVLARGGDRAAWLHNLVTHAVKTLDAGQGVYGFAIDVKGRTQFDLNILVRSDALALDIDAVTVPAAMAHLERYLITEDVALEDVTPAFARLGCAGPAAAAAARELGVGNLVAMAALNHAALAEPGAWLIRHDFAGLPGFELIAPQAEAAAWWERLAGLPGVEPVGVQTAELLRIEAGIPAWGSDIDDSVIPPETGQIERGISYNKGCYLGQEIIERMRSLGAPARRLVRLRIANGQGLAMPCPLTQNGREVGRVTSLARHALGHWVGLGYLRASVADATGLKAGEPPRDVEVVAPASADSR